MTLVVLAFLAGTCAADAKLKVLHAFCALTDCADGEGPTSGLVQDTLGNLYGTTSSGGAQNNGTIFKLSRDPVTGKWMEQVIYLFCKDGYPCTDGFNPSGPLIIDSSGNLYGTTRQGGNDNDAGVAFELMPNGDRTDWSLKVLHVFCSKATAQADCADGNGPFRSGLAYQGQSSGAPYDGISPLYGTTEVGGRHISGVAFQLTPVAGTSKWKEDVIYDFCATPDCADGQSPWRKLVIDASGDVFGVAGEFRDHGIAYQLSPKKGRWQETVLHRFCPRLCTDGIYPNDLAIDANGALFGTTYGGGTHDWGTIFKIVPAGTNSSYRVLYNFCAQPQCADGGASDAGVALDAQGNLYGSTGDSNESLTGTIFRLAPDGTLTTLHTFCLTNCNDGEYPGSVLLGPHNTIYGTAGSGGQYGHGTAFRLSY